MKSKKYLGNKFYITLLLVGLVVAPLIPGIIFGVSVDETRGVFAFLYVFTGYLLLLSIAVFFMRATLFGHFVVDEKGIKTTFMGKTKKSIDWNEIKNVDVNLSEGYTEIGRINEYRLKNYKNRFYAEDASKLGMYVILAKDIIYDLPHDNLNNNICIGIADEEIHAMITPHLNKIAEEQRQKIKDFFWIENSSK